MRLRSLLFVPADSERKFAKAQTSGADGLILDLEDAVAPTRKPLAREMVQEMLAADASRNWSFWVRVNALDTGLTLEDLSAALEVSPELVIEYDTETFGLAANNGQMIEECSRKARAAQQFRTLAMTLAQRSEPKASVRTSPLAPILDRLRLRA